MHVSVQMTLHTLYMDFRRAHFCANDLTYHSRICPGNKKPMKYDVVRTIV